MQANIRSFERLLLAFYLHGTQKTGRGKIPPGHGLDT
jgi:hypothetical protein